MTVAEIMAEMLADLSQDEDALVRRVVVRNLRTPPKTLAALAADDDASVRDAAAANPNTPNTALPNHTSEY
jgi:hypothetical protein